MGRRRTGHTVDRGGRKEAWVGDHYLGIFDSEEVAQSVIASWLRQESGAAPDRFSTFFAEWLDDRELTGHVRSVGKERSSARAHIEAAPWFDWPFKRIQPMVLQQWTAKLFATKATHAITRKGGVVERRELNRNLSRKTVANTLQLVARCFDYAVIAGKVATNPARAVILPPPTVKAGTDQLVIHALVEEIDALFALELPPLQRAVFAVAIYCGLRKGEIWGLQWQDVVLDGAHPRLQVRRSYDGPPKNRRAIRDVPLLPGTRVREALRVWKAAQGATPIAGRLVFPGDDGCHHESYTARWQDHRSSAGVRPGWASKAGIRPEVTFACLRHSYGCHLLQGTWGKPLTLSRVSKLMGHSSQSVTERHYAWITDRAAIVDLYDVEADAE